GPVRTSSTIPTIVGTSPTSPAASAVIGPIGSGAAIPSRLYGARAAGAAVPVQLIVTVASSTIATPIFCSYCEPSPKVTEELLGTTLTAPGSEPSAVHVAPAASSCGT